MAELDHAQAPTAVAHSRAGRASFILYTITTSCVIQLTTVYKSLDSTLQCAQMQRVLCPCNRPWSINCELVPQAKARTARARGSRKSKHNKYPDTVTVTCVREGCNGSKSHLLSWNRGDKPCEGGMCSCWQNDRIKLRRMEVSNGNPFACEEDPVNAQACCHWLHEIELSEHRLTAKLEKNLTPEPVARERQTTPLNSKRALTPVYHGQYYHGQ